MSVVYTSASAIKGTPALAHSTAHAGRCDSTGKRCSFEGGSTHFIYCLAGLVCAGALSKWLHGNSQIIEILFEEFVSSSNFGKSFAMNTVAELPLLNDVKTIDPVSIKSFTDNGHVLIKNILSQDEMDLYRPVINDAAYRYNSERRKMEDRDTYGKAFLQIMNLWEVDEAARKFVMAKRFASIAAQLLGVEKVRLYHDQALYKEAGGGFTPWHQDQFYWPLDTNKTVTMWMPLIDISVEMGMLTFASGSHKNGMLKNVPISDESEVYLNNYIKENKYEVTRATTMKAGDATWHSGWVLHSAPGNQSSQTREVITIIYFANGAKVTTPKSNEQENDRQRWLCGIEPGQLAASKLNPIL